jgi:hypothetical protein
MSKLVYLAGPITGLSYEGATDWREYARDHISNNITTDCFNKAMEKTYTARVSTGIDVLSPMRAKRHLEGIKNFTADGDKYKSFSVLSSNRGIMTRDRWDATRCDVLLVNLLGAKTVSVGTVMEMAWANQARTPIVCAIEPGGNVHEHGMLMEAIGFRVPTLDEAICVVKALLLP